MRLETLDCFVILNDMGSFHAAANVMNLSQPALSRRISKLEADLGVNLLDRKKKKVTLTPVGKECLESAKQIVTLSNKLVKRTREVGEATGRKISIGTIPSMIEPLVIPVARKFNETYKLARISVHEVNSEMVLKFVADGDVDFGIGISMTRSDETEFLPLFTEPLCIAFSQDHALSDKPKLSWKILENYPVSYNSTTSGNWLQLQSALKSRDVYPDWRFECLSLMGVMSFVVNGSSVAVLPKSLSTSGLANSLIFRDIPQDPIERQIGVFSKPTRRSIELVNRLLEMIQQAVAAPDFPHFSRATSLSDVQSYSSDNAHHR